MPNQPKTPFRGVRIPDELWIPSEQEAAERTAETGVKTTASDIVREALAEHHKRRQRRQSRK